jgi:hypothetical protein
MLWHFSRKRGRAGLQPRRRSDFSRPACLAARTVPRLRDCAGRERYDNSSASKRRG